MKLFFWAAAISRYWTRAMSWSTEKKRIIQKSLFFGVLTFIVCYAYFNYFRPSKFVPPPPAHVRYMSDSDRDVDCWNLKPITGVDDLLELPDSAELRRFNEAGPNGERIEQDDLSLLKYFWSHCVVLMRPPDGKPTTHKGMGASMGQDEIVRRIYKNMTGGFYLEVGAFDGVTSSNTLELERDLGWKGLLIEAGRQELAKLHKTHRNAWISHSCISVHNYPHEVMFHPDAGGLGRVAKVLDDPNSVQNQRGTERIQCFPLYTFIATLNITVIDFLSLDVEGFELPILKTIPFEKVLIKVIAVEIVNAKEGPGPYKEFMEAQGFRTLGLFYDAWKPFDLIFVHKSLPADVSVLDLLKPKKDGRYNH